MKPKEKITASERLEELERIEWEEQRLFDIYEDVKLGQAE
jgi:hypothetical protein